MNGFPSLSQDQWCERQSGCGVGPRFGPNRVHRQPAKGDPCHVTAEGRFGCIGFQSGARCDSCQRSFLAGKPRHRNSCGQQDCDSEQTALRLAIPYKIQDRSEHNKSRQSEKQSPGDTGCPRLAKAKPKAPEHYGCGEELDQTVPAKSEQRRAVRMPSRRERNGCFDTHPNYRDDLKSEHSSRNIGKRRGRGYGHNQPCDHSTLQLQRNELLGLLPDSLGHRTEARRLWPHEPARTQSPEACCIMRGQPSKGWEWLACVRRTVRTCPHVSPSFWPSSNTASVEFTEERTS